ncbi:MAG TPA: hypothetical protein VFH59_07800 [Frateuria sp.]|uniref:hypothetical protein n=1 Tax=Frateuria sp. TaxID=2211372 RepID=UPI002D804392|nr:hypothetical protein [Frateuria sp.]HET6805325.1 hypothetical protein [Frateuria sp.]
MFRFASDGRVRWPLSIDQLQEDGGTAAASFVVEYRAFTRDELKQRDAALREYARQMAELMPVEGALDTADHASKRQALTEARVKADDDQLRERVKGWKGIADPSGAEIPFTPDNLQALLNNVLVRDVLLAGLVEASTGARGKNSLPGLAGLPVPAQA